jgi:predicted 3-demethylubiquinone-9 3-methyltransferase (glyoxalase superfamily)
MSNKIYPCIWFDGNAKEATEFYCSLFKDAAIRSVNPSVVGFELGGHRFMALNGGPQFKPNASMSFYVTCETGQEIDFLWERLKQDGMVMMALDRYEWSERYGWVQDAYGVSWQLSMGKVADIGQKIIPALMFTGAQFGRGDEAIKHFTSIFPDSQLRFIHRYDETDMLQGGKIAHAQFSLSNQKFILMDSGLSHDLCFSEGLSLVVECEDQQEIDYYWDHLKAGGEASRCGWLKDKFGFSWQVVPSKLGMLMNDPTRSERVMKALLGMKKLELDQLENA